MLTLVNTVNKKSESDPDLLMFFKKLEEIANGKIEKKIIGRSKAGFN